MNSLAASLRFIRSDAAFELRIFPRTINVLCLIVLSRRARQDKIYTQNACLASTTSAKFLLSTTEELWKSAKPTGLVNSHYHSQISLAERYSREPQPHLKLFIQNLLRSLQYITIHTCIDLSMRSMSFEIYRISNKHNLKEKNHPKNRSTTALSFAL